VQANAFKANLHISNKNILSPLKRFDNKESTWLLKEAMLFFIALQGLNDYMLLHAARSSSDMKNKIMYVILW